LNNRDIDQGNVGQVQHFAGSDVIHRRSYAVKIAALNPAAQSKNGYESGGVFVDSQHAG
jgi:hypothetical protein